VPSLSIAAWRSRFGAALLLLLVILAVFALAKGLPKEHNTPGAPQSMLQNDAAQPESTERFVNRLQKRNGTFSTTTAGGTFVAVRVAQDVRYRIHPATSYQELAITDSALLRPFMQQLDAQGIEYAVLQNMSAAVILRSGEWVISWGGILYLPKLQDSFFES
jgi:hypothetical protein